MIIQIPEGKTQMTLGNGMVIPFPKGATTVNIPDELLQQKEIPSLEIPKEEPNQNPFIQQGEEGYNNQVHSMDMEAINNAPAIDTNKPKTFLDTVKDFGSSLLGGIKKGTDATAEPIMNAIQKAQDTIIKPNSNNLTLRAIEDTANFFTPVGEFDFVSQYDKSEVDNAKEEGDVSWRAYAKMNQLAKTGQSLTLDNKEGIKTYNENLGKIVIDDFGFDDFGVGEDGKYYARKGDDITELNKNIFKEIVSDIYGDKAEIGGAALLAKKAFDASKGLGKKGQFAATLAGGAVGAMAGNMIDIFDSMVTNGERLNLSQINDENLKAGVLDAGAGLATAGIIKGGGALIDGANKVLPIGEDKLAQKYVDTKTNINSAENLESANIAKELGASDTKLTQLASDSNAQKAMSDMFENSKEMREAVLKDHEKLTNNLYTTGNIAKFQNNEAENVNDIMGGLIEEQVKGIDSVYKKVYGDYKNDIVEIFGDKPLNVAPKTATIVKDKINMLNIDENAAGDLVEKSKNQLDETYAGILNIAKEAFTDVDGQYIDKFKISKMMDLNKEINQYAKLHEDKLTPKHFEVIREIRTAIDDDIYNYADIALDADNAKFVKDKWQDIKGGYSEWLFGIGKDGNKIENLLKDTSNIKTLATDMVGNGTIKNEYLETFGDIALHLRKTNPNALADLQDTVVNAILQPITVKQKFDGNTYEFVDFDMFDKMFNEKTISTKGLNKIFGSSKDGQKKLDTLKAFRKLAADEREIQNAIYKNQSPLSEAGQKAVETKRSFLFGVKYFFTRTLVNAMASRVIPSVAFDKMVIDLSSKQRYTLKDMDTTLRKIENTREYKSFTPDEKIYLKNLRAEAEDYEAGIAEQTKKRMEEENIKTQQELFEKIKKDADDKIKANMLLEHKAIIPPAQIKEGAKEPLGLDIQDRISVKNTKQPSIEPAGQKTQPTTFDEFTSKTGIDKNEIIQKVEQENNTKQILENPIFNQEDLKLTAPKDGKYNFDNLIEFEGLVKATGNNPADLLQMDKFTNMKGIRNAITRYSEGKPTQRDIEILDGIQRFMNNEGEKFKTRVNDNTSNFDKVFEEADKAGNIPFSNPVVGGASLGAASGTQTDFNQDGKVDEVDVMIGTLIGTIGIKKTMDIFPQYFKK